MTKKKNLGIWMDHSKAVFIDVEDKTNDFTILAGSNENKKVDSLTRNEKAVHNKEQQFQIAYYKNINEHLADCERLILFGPTSAKMEFYNYLKEGDMLKNIAIETTDKMSMNELHAYVNKHFQNQIS